MATRTGGLKQPLAGAILDETKAVVTYPVLSSDRLEQTFRLGTDPQNWNKVVVMSHLTDRCFSASLKRVHRLLHIRKWLANAYYSR